MDHAYAQPTVPMFYKLPVEIICRLIVTLNGGTIGNDANHKCGYLYPGFQGGRELHYFEISRDAMTFWKHVCKYLRLTYSMHHQVPGMLLSDNKPKMETFERYVPRHLYAGNPKPWMMKLCSGPQTEEDVLAIEAAEQAKEKRKQKRRKDAGTAFIESWGAGERRLCARK